MIWSPIANVTAYELRHCSMTTLQPLPTNKLTEDDLLETEKSTINHAQAACGHDHSNKSMNNNQPLKKSQDNPTNVRKNTFRKRLKTSEAQ
eukprot:scaffold2068_cov96-Cylindrotheca_fusiformis.AAC.9